MHQDWLNGTALHSRPCVAYSTTIVFELYHSFSTQYRKTVKELQGKCRIKYGFTPTRQRWKQGHAACNTPSDLAVDREFGGTVFRSMANGAAYGYKPTIPQAQGLLANRECLPYRRGSEGEQQD